jgi:hypothetical protein
MQEQNQRQQSNLNSELESFKRQVRTLEVRFQETSILIIEQETNSSLHQQLMESLRVVDEKVNAIEAMESEKAELEQRCAEAYEKQDGSM